jgi:AcrR family transcriptional regulator
MAMLYVNACWPTLVDMTAVPPPRRSDATRARILRSARAEFAAGGYDRATIRGIAAGADIDPSLVMRYFGSKADLFDAIVEIDLRLPDLTKVPRRRLGETLVGHFLTRWEGDPADDALLTLLRSAATDENAANRMRGIFRHQLVAALVDIVSDPAEAATRAGLIATQMLGLALCRHIVRLPPVVALEKATIIQFVGSTIQRYVTADLRGLKC